MRLATLLLLIVCNRIQATLPQYYVHTFCWSPDGKKMLYVKEIADSTTITDELYIINTDGSENKLLVKDAFAPAGSADGKKIAYCKNVNDQYDIFIAGADGSNAKQITNNDYDDIEPSFSPDGKWLSYTSKKTGKYQVCIMDINGDDITEITTTSGIHSLSSSWSTDGKKLVYYKDAGDGKDRIYVADVASKKEQSITDDTLHNFYPTCIIDGKILYTCREKKEDGILNTILYVIDPNGNNKRSLHLIAWNGRFSTDGKQIAYIKNAADHEGSELFIADVGGKKVRQLTGK